MEVLAGLPVDQEICDRRLETIAMMQVTTIAPSTIAVKPDRWHLHHIIGRSNAITKPFLRAGGTIRATYGYLAISVALSILLFAAASPARDYGQYENLSPAIRTWIKGLTDNLRVPCCAIADGSVPDAWEMQKDHYRVKVYGEWLVVPSSAVIKGPNYLGHAVVWVYGAEDRADVMEVRCFLPGPQS